MALDPTLPARLQTLAPTLAARWQHELPSLSPPLLAHLSQAIVAWLSQPDPDPDEAQRLGALLAEGCQRAVESLVRSQAVLGRELVASLAPEEAQALYPSIAILLSQLTAGFLAAFGPGSAEPHDTHRLHQLQVLLEEIPLVLFEIDHEGRFTHLIGAGLRDRQRQAGEFVGRTLFELYADYPEVISNFERALNGETFTKLVQLDDIYYESWYAPQRGPDGQITGVIGVSMNITEQLKVRRKMRAQGHELEAIFDTLPDLFFRLAWDGTILEQRAGKRSDLYRDPKEFLGKRFQDILPPSVVEPIQQAVREAHDQQQLVTTEYTLPFPEGTRWFEARILPFDQEQVICLIRNITEHKQILETLQQNEARLRLQSALLQAQSEAAPDGILVTDREQLWLFFNQHLLDLWGIDPPPFANRPYMQGLKQALQKVQDPNAFLSRLNELFDNMELEGWDEIVLKDGRILERFSAPVRREGGGYYGRVWYYRDITTRKQAEAERAHLYYEAEEMQGTQRAILDATNEALALLAPGGHFLMVNRRLTDLFSLSRPRLLTFDPSQIYTLFHQAFNQVPWMAADGTLVQGDVPRRFHLTQRWPTLREVELFITDVYGGKGRYLGQLLAFRDITHEREVERMKREFVSIVSHELRTPLTSIRGSLGLLLGSVAGEIPEPIKQLIEIADKNSERLILLINDILDIEKIESGQMTFKLEPQPLYPLVSQAIEGNRGFAKQMQVALTLHDRFPEAQVKVDGNRLIQVLTNLLSNAAKFSPPGESIEVEIQDAPLGVRVSVRDHGLGIPPEFQAHLFEKFAQADASDTRRLGGSGLGLSIARAIMQQLGGQIGFMTEPGAGSTFFIDLPLWEETKEAPPLPAPQRGPRVLLCQEGSEGTTDLLQQLNQQGLLIDQAMTLAEARHHLARDSYSLILFDLQTPDDTGLEQLKALHTWPESSGIPLLVLAASPDSRQDPSLKWVQWIEKPIDPPTLQQAIHQALQRKGEQSKAHILYLEDDDDIARVISRILEDIATTVHVHTVEQAVEQLRQHPFDLLLLDVYLRKGQLGLDLLPQLPYELPVVIFSAYEVNSLIEKQVAATLIKSRTSPKELKGLIQQLIDGNQA